jgi:hypothetical protein
MRLRSRIAWLIVGALVLSALPARAQSPAPTPPYPRFEVTGGYQFLHVPDFNFPFGLNVDGAWNGSKALGLAGEVGWATGSEDDVRLHAWTIGVGPRFNGRPMGGRLWPFAQVLVGMYHLRGEDDSATKFQVQPGGGVNINAGDGWGVVLQGDYRRVFLDEDEDGESGQNQGRFFVGIRLLLD